MDLKRGKEMFTALIFLNRVLSLEIQYFLLKKWLVQVKCKNK